MRFSVILPVYNVEAYLRECVSSILNQTYKDYEIILVDDGSTDASPRICDELSEKYNCISVVHKKNGGAADSRNAGTKEAKGDYVVYLDSDDFILDKEFLKKLDERAKSNVDLIFYKYQKYYNENGRLEECGFSYLNAMQEKTYENKIDALVKGDAFYGMAWIKAIKKSIISENNIEFEVGLLGEDMEWNYHIIYHATSVEFIDEPMIAYRQREGSVTSEFKLKNLTDFIYILEKWSERIKKEITNEKLKNALYGSLAKYYSNMLVVYSRLLDPQKKRYDERIKKMDWLLKFSMSRRPQLIYKVYKIVGFKMTIIVLRILDRIRK